jgi:arabinose-5-phosphate isomerase
MTDDPRLSGPDEKSISPSRTGVDTVIRVLRAESAAIADAAAGVGPDLESVLTLLGQVQGAVVVTGLGKSGLVGAKIAATLASTGTVAHFVHATEALHGDAGRLRPGDCLIALSQSGTTAEVVAFAELANQRGIPVVAFTADRTSALARAATACLSTQVAGEADPLGLAPTNSTAVMLAVGDALAIALMELRGTTVADFHANHPAGALGRISASRIRGEVGS